MAMTGAVIYTIFAAILVVFQIALALGAPWGHLAMGGRWPGRFPMRLRIGAAVQGAMMAGLALIVLNHAGLVTLNAIPGWAIWPVLVLSCIGAVLNLITPSIAERKLWGPVALAMLAGVVLAMFGKA